MPNVGIQNGFFGWVMKVGNKLPNPFFLFASLMVITLGLSAWLSYLGVAVEADLVDKASNKLVHQVVQVRNLMSLDYLHFVMKNFTKIYIDFAPLGLVMVTMIGIGYVQESKFFDVAMTKATEAAPASMVTFIVITVSILSTIASNAGIIISTTLAAAVFASMRKNPILGAIIGYVAAHGGEPCNFIVTGFMVMLSSITGAAAEAAGISEPSNPLIVYFFFMPMVFVLAGSMTFVTEKIMPRLMDVSWKPDSVVLDRRLAEAFSATPEHKSTDSRVTSYKGVIEHTDDVRNLATTIYKSMPNPTRGLKWAGIGTLLYVIVILFGCVPEDGFLRNTAGQLLPKSPLIDGIVAILVVWFFIVGTCFGLGYKSIRSQNDVPKFMCSGLKDAANYFVVCFPAAFFIKFFSDSKLSIILSVKGSELLQSMHFTGLPLALSFIILVMFLNLFVTSGSAKWLIMAPIFVPMFYSVGFTPAMTQLIYQIGDKITDPIAPINYYIPIVITIIEKYRKDTTHPVGMGDVLSMTMPYALAEGIILISVFCAWYYLGWPIGPDVYMFR